MSKAAFTLVFAVLICAPASRAAYYQDGAGALPINGQDAALRDELCRMHAAAQQLRQRAVAFKFRDKTVNEEMDELDRTHTKRLREIVRQHGWPTVDAVGRDGLGAAFFLVQQSSCVKFQREVLPALGKAAERGEVAMEAYAMLEDRVLLKEGKRQIYGTQAEFRDGRVVLAPIDDGEHVNVRRGRIGLRPVEEYLADLERAYGNAPSGRE